MIPAIIYGTGKSLESLNMNMPSKKGYVHIAVNLWYKCSDKFPKGWQPDSWVFWDTQRYRTAVQEYLIKGNYSGFVYHWGDLYPKGSRFEIYNMDIFKKTLPLYQGKTIGLRGDHALAKAYSDFLGYPVRGYSSSNVAYAIAIFNRYSPIFFAGQDFINYNKEVDNKFHYYVDDTDKDYIRKNPWLKTWPNVKNEFIKLKALAEKLGLETYNLTPGNNAFSEVFKPYRKVI